MTSRVSWPLVAALRTTAERLTADAPYQWGHMGSCNCGHLAQTVTHLSKAEIHARALQRHGDWEQQLIDYCPSSGLPFDAAVDELLALGFSRPDLTSLEKLSDPAVLAALPRARRQTLRHNRRDDVVAYLRAWADLLARKLALAEAPAAAPVLERAGAA